MVRRKLPDAGVPDESKSCLEKAMPRFAAESQVAAGH